MKIAIITNIPAPYRIPVYENIAKTYGDNFLVLFCAKRELNRAWQIDPAEFKFRHIFLKENMRPKKDGFNFIHNNPDVLKEIKIFSPDIIITTGMNPTHLYGWLYSLMFNKKHIYMTDGWLYSEKNISLFHKILRKVVFKSSHAFICAGRHGRRLLNQYGIKDEKIFISRLCVNNELFKNTKCFEEREYHLMFSGSLTDRKNISFFCDVSNFVKKSIPGLRTIILGDGPYRDSMIKYMEKNNIYFNYLGFVEQKILPYIYQNALLFLFPTKLDPWGVVVNEALASGTPVITSPYSGVINDLVINGKNGYIINLNVNDWAEKIIDVINNRILWEKLSYNAKESIKEFNFDNAAIGIINACKYVIRSAK